MSDQIHSVNVAAQKARDYRTHIGLDATGPVPDLLRVVEDVAGVAVSVIDLPNGVSGAYTFEEGLGFAFVNLKEPVVRQRFTLAHELAHHAFEDRGVVDSERAVFGEPTNANERRAQTFSAEFLVPLRAVSAWVEARAASDVTLRLVVELASYFRVSAKVALVRLHLARLVSEAQESELSNAINRGEHLTLAKRVGIEEAPDSLSEIKSRGRPRTPARMWEYAVGGYEQGLLSVERIAQAVHSTPEEVQALLDELGVTPREDEPDY